MVWAQGKARAVIAVLLVAALVLSMLGRDALSSPAQTRPVPLGRVAHPNRVAVLMLENRSFGQVIGNPSTPYLNSLGRQGALATHYFALTHPSLPNYVALTTGGHQRVGRDCARCLAAGRSLVNQLEAAGISWRAYFENRPSRLASSYSRAALYDRHYNPFVYEASIARRGVLSGGIQGFRALDQALAAHSLPQFTWIAPNVRHDGHSSKLSAVDSFARGLVPRVLRALGPRGVLFIAWDEGKRSDHSGLHGRGGGHVALMAVGPGAARRARVSVPADHYALLKTIEGIFGLRPLGHAASSSTPVLSGLLRG